MNHKERKQTKDTFYVKVGNELLKVGFVPLFSPERPLMVKCPLCGLMMLGNGDNQFCPECGIHE